MEEIIRKIVSIQNKQKTLRWGHTYCGDNECLFVVGNTAYPGITKCLTITEDFIVSIVDDNHKKVSQKHCDELGITVSTVIQFLKEWFPAKTI